MEIEDDVLDLIRHLPEDINEAGTTTEFKFLTVGSVLWRCYEEIKELRAEVQELRNAKARRKGSYLRRMQKDIR